MNDDEGTAEDTAGTWWGYGLGTIVKGQILAVWILAAKLLCSDLNFAVDFGVEFFLLFFQGKRPQSNPPPNRAKILQKYSKMNFGVFGVFLPCFLWGCFPIL